MLLTRLKIKKEEKKMAEEKVEKKEETKKEKKEEIKLSAGMKSVMDTLEKMTVLELSDFVKALEDKFGVSAQAPMAMPGMMMAPGAGGAGQAAAEEKTAFTVVLAEIGANKIQVIKEIRAITTLGLKEAKDLVEAAPKPVKEGATKEEAEKIKAQLEKTGAKVELK
jgi:large subunit ribosomal protein L7/L12